MPIVLIPDDLRNFPEIIISTVTFHAAIVGREMNKLTIVGATFAT